VVELQFLADHVENNVLFKHDVECQELIMEALKYHLLPERRLAMQSSRTKPRKSTVGVLYAVGGMDCTKGNDAIFTFYKVLQIAGALWLRYFSHSRVTQVQFLPRLGTSYSWLQNGIWPYPEKFHLPALILSILRLLSSPYLLAMRPLYHQQNVVVEIGYLQVWSVGVTSRCGYLSDN